MLLRTMSAPAQYVQDNGSKLGIHTFVGCYTGCVPLFKTLSVPADYVRDNGTQAQSLADTFEGWHSRHIGSVLLFKTEQW